jgi:hypothetical protein
VMSGDLRSGDAGLGVVRLGVAGSVRRRGVGRRGVRSCGVSQAAWGRVGGRGGCTRGWSGGRAGVCWTVGSR